VYCHPAEVAHAQRDYLEQASPAALMPQAWRPTWLRWSAAVARKGGLVRAGIPAVRALTAEIAATLPGRPVALPTPGHTSGHCSYVVDGVLVSGDALVTGHPLSQRRGPQLLPSVFNHSDDDCARSLSVLAAAGTEILIPGHGDVWTGPIADAARLAGV
jgi:glyoxylase-like metal-dependent hydrolase (beta-lactamase superfamily II)